MPNPKRGETWLVRFPFSNLRDSKIRPALVLAIHGKDRILSAIYSHVPGGPLRPSWILLEDQDADFAQLGLKKTSILKAEKLAVVDESVFIHRLGRFSAQRLKSVERALRVALQLP